MTLPGFPNEVVDSVLLGLTCKLVCGRMVKQTWVTVFDHKNVLNLKKVKLAQATVNSPVGYIVCIKLCLLKGTDSEYLLSEYLS